MSYEWQMRELERQLKALNEESKPRLLLPGLVDYKYLMARIDVLPPPDSCPIPGARFQTPFGEMELTEDPNMPSGENPMAVDFSQLPVNYASLHPNVGPTPLPPSPTECCAYAHPGKVFETVPNPLERFNPRARLVELTKLDEKIRTSAARGLREWPTCAFGGKVDLTRDPVVLQQANHSDFVWRETSPVSITYYFRCNCCPPMNMATEPETEPMGLSDYAIQGTQGMVFGAAALSSMMVAYLAKLDQGVSGVPDNSGPSGRAQTMGVGAGCTCEYCRGNEAE